MKKITLLCAAFIVAFSVNAQISTSWEAADGFALGNLSGQNGWGASAAGVDNVLVSDEESSDGDFSIKMEATNAPATIGAFSPLEASTGDVVIVTIDCFVEDSGGNPSTIEVATQSPAQSLLSARVRYNPGGAILILDTNPGTGMTEFIDSGETFELDEWFNLKIEHRFADNEILYYIDDNLIYTGVVFGATIVEQVIPLFDNVTSSAYFDNLTYDGNFLSIEGNTLAEQISVYPNPTQGDLNIKIATNFENLELNITNVAGQRVMNTSIEGTTSTISTSELAAGVYFARISNDTESTVIKFVKN